MQPRGEKNRFRAMWFNVTILKAKRMSKTHARSQQDASKCTLKKHWGEYSIVSKLVILVYTKRQRIPVI